MPLKVMQENIQHLLAVANKTADGWYSVPEGSEQFVSALHRVGVDIAIRFTNVAGEYAGCQYSDFNAMQFTITDELL